MPTSMLPFPRLRSFVGECRQRASTRKGCGVRLGRPALVRFSLSAGCGPFAAHMKSRVRGWVAGIAGSRGAHVRRGPLSESLGFSGQCFVVMSRRNNSPSRRNHFPLWRRCPETAVGYQAANETADAAGTDNRRQSDADDQLHPRLRLYPGWSLDGWFSDQNLPGVGTFAYQRFAGCNPALQPILVAAK